MKKTFKRWENSCYEIELVVSTADYEAGKAKMLKEFQKDLELPGFRKGHAPMDKVEENVKPEYMTIGIYEGLINEWLQEVVKENPEIRFIGQPYGVDQKKEGEDTLVTVKLDFFPEVEVKDEEWKKHKMNKISTKVEQKEIDDAVVRLQKNYADYIDADEITPDTISKMTIQYLDKDGKEVDKGNSYIGEPEFSEGDFYHKEFVGKKKDEEVEMRYDTKKLPDSLLSRKKDLEIDKVKFNIVDIKKVVLPEINAEMIEKLFGKEADVKTKEDLVAFVEKSIADQKFDSELMKWVEELLSKIKDKHMVVPIPQTLIDEEMWSRIKNLEQRFGWEENMKKYFESMWEEKKTAFMEDIAKAAKESLEKFFILQKIVHLLELDVNWEKPEHLEIEKKVYEKFSS